MKNICLNFFFFLLLISKETNVASQKIEISLLEKVIKYGGHLSGQGVFLLPSIKLFYIKFYHSFTDILHLYWKWSVFNIPYQIYVPVEYFQCRSYPDEDSTFGKGSLFFYPSRSTLPMQLGQDQSFIVKKKNASYSVSKVKNGRVLKFLLQIFFPLKYFSFFRKGRIQMTFCKKE